jgi:hypothetical protein
VGLQFQTSKCKKVKLSKARIYFGVRFLPGVHVVPVEMLLGPDDVVLEAETKDPYVMPDQKMVPMADIRPSIPPAPKAPIGGDVSGEESELEPDMADEPIAGGKARPKTEEEQEVKEVLEGAEDPEATEEEEEEEEEEE